MNKKTLTLIGIILIPVTVATAATLLFLYPYNPTQPPKSDDTGWSEEGTQEVVDANNQFALELYTELSKNGKENIFYSPYSIFAALGMTYEGAKGETKDEIKSVFHFPEDSTLRPNFAKIYNDINKNEEDYELRTGNALWVQKDYPFLEDYINIVVKYYGGKASNLDFVKETEKSRQTINSFIEEQTNGKIKDLIPKGVLDYLTRLVLTNAIYFKGTWQWEFNPKNTEEVDFKITPTDIVKVPMMYMKPEKAKFNYADLEDLQILELPYKGEKISMLILLPKDNLEDIQPLTIEKLKEWKSQTKEETLDEIYLPKFEFDTKYFMKEILSDMGMPTAFEMDADFSGMDGTKSLYIKEVIHQAYVKVDEKGTEAAAATGVVMELTSIMPKNIFRADHPFIFIIQQNDTGNILFLGRVNDPTK
ncbi:MAG TPA: serpin family protein [Caldisericia bacterium]|nr:serpin family protein [Caldisericia bacterium]